MRHSTQTLHRLYKSHVLASGSGSISLAGTSASITLPKAVNPDNTLVFFNGYSTVLNTGNSPASSFPRVDLSSATQITAYCEAWSGFAATVNYGYIEFAPGVLLLPVVRGTIALASVASAAVTLANSYDLNRHVINCLGFTTNDTGTGATPWADATTKHRVELTAVNQITAYRYTAGSITATVAYQIAQFRK